MSDPPPSQKGNCRCTNMLAMSTSRLMTDVQRSPWRNTLRAFAKSLEPMKWATCTEKPSDAALVMLPMSHVVLSTRPMAAEAPAPKWPTIEASMKNMSTAVTCAKIDGMLRLTISLSLSLVVIDRPSRMSASNASLFFKSANGFKGVQSYAKNPD